MRLAVIVAEMSSGLDLGSGDGINGPLVLAMLFQRAARSSRARRMASCAIAGASSLPREGFLVLRPQADARKYADADGFLTLREVAKDTGFSATETQQKGLRPTRYFRSARKLGVTSEPIRACLDTKASAPGVPAAAPLIGGDSRVTCAVYSP